MTRKIQNPQNLSSNLKVLLNNHCTEKTHLLILRKLANQPDWITALHTTSKESRKRAELENKRRDLKQRIDRVRDTENNQTVIELAEKANKKRAKRNVIDKDEEFLIGDYDSDEENGATTTVNKSDTTSNLSAEVQALLAK